MKGRFLIPALVLLLHGCASEEDRSVHTVSLGSLDDYPCCETVSTPFDIHDTTVVSHEDIWIEDSLLIVKSQNRNGFLRFYSLNTGEFIKSYGIIGRGPDEYLYPQVFKNPNGTFVISDRMKFGVINVEDLLLDSFYKAELHPVKQGLMSVNFFSYFPNRDLVVYNSGNKESMLDFMSLNDMRIEEYAKFPSVSNEKVPPFVANTNVFRSCMASDSNYVYAAYNLYPVIDIISIDEKSVRRSVHPMPSAYNRIIVKDDLNAVVDNRFICNLDIDVVGGNIYTLYFGKLEDDMDVGTIPQILKYNQSGELVKRYELKNCVYKICIDESEGVAYAISFNEDYESCILKILLD